MDYVGSLAIVKEKQKNYSDVILKLDRIYDEIERLVESMYPNGPNDKAPTPALRKSSCDTFRKKLKELDAKMNGINMTVAAKNDIRNLMDRTGVLINCLQQWEQGGEEKYTPYFLDEFMPEYERIGDLYR